jgi:putative SOS response-associated peptidase YedK
MSRAMCGRVRLSSDVNEIKLVFSIPPERPMPNIAASWNVAPTDPLPVVRYDSRAGERSLDVMRWGLVPFWVKASRSALPTSMPRPKGSRAGQPSAKPSSAGAAWCRSTISMNGGRPQPANSPMPSRSPIGA